MKTPWQEFYENIKDPLWPECDFEDNFFNLPEHIQKECINIHGYSPGEYKKQSLYSQNKFPIDTKTACQLKWNWSTVYLYSETTASCHRTNHHKFDTDIFDFHNTPSKLDDRKQMLKGNWPTVGCDYCKDIEKVGGQSDRITNLDFPGIYPPVELSDRPDEINVTPRILEVYFDNQCNLKCVYCGPHFSSLWEQENKKFSKEDLIHTTRYQGSKNLEKNTDKLFEWLEKNVHSLTNMNILGGEPLYQHQLDRCFSFFEENPAPNLSLQIFSNLNAPFSKIENVIKKIKYLIDNNHIRSFSVTASLDCWGPSAEFARFPLKLDIWERNFLRFLQEDYIELIVGSTITPVTIGTLYQLFEKIEEYNQVRPVYRYFNSAETPDYMQLDIFGNALAEYFDKAIDVYSKYANTQDDQQRIEYLKGIALQSVSGKIDLEKVTKLYDFLEEMNYKRGTDWRKSCPWLEKIFKDILNR